MDKKIYKAVAKAHGVSVKEVKEEMEKAVASAFENPNELSKQIPCENSTPTVEEVIDFAVKEIQKSDDLKSF